MAFQKTLTRRGVPGNYIKIRLAPADYSAKEISVHFALYYSAEAAVTDPAQPLDETVAKLRLKGAKFDEYLSTAALAVREADDPFRAALYAAAKVEPVICNEPPAEGCATIFTDALNV